MLSSQNTKNELKSYVQFLSSLLAFKTRGEFKFDYRPSQVNQKNSLPVQQAIHTSTTTKNGMKIKPEATIASRKYSIVAKPFFHFLFLIHVSIFHILNNCLPSQKYFPVKTRQVLSYGCMLLHTYL